MKETEPDSSDYAAQLGQFRTYVRSLRPRAAGTADLNTVLELACAKGLHEHLDILLDMGLDSSGAAASAGALEAAFYGHAGALRVLKAHGCTFGMVKAHTRETVLHLVLKMGADGVERERYAACLETLLDDAGGGAAAVSEEMRRLVNRRDELGNTALHLATQRWDQAVVRKLLEMGANIGIKVGFSFSLSFLFFFFFFLSFFLSFFSFFLLSFFLSFFLSCFLSSFP